MVSCGPPTARTLAFAGVVNTQEPRSQVLPVVHSSPSLSCTTARRATAPPRVMILPDDTPESPTKSRAGPPSEEPEEEEHALPPPAYPGPPLNGQFPSSQLPNVDLEAQASTSRTPLLQPTPAYHVEAVERAPARFLKAFGVAVLIYIVAASFTRTAIAGVYWSGHNTHRVSPARVVDPRVCLNSPEPFLRVYSVEPHRNT